MAIKFALDSTAYGIVCPQAYVKINRISADKDNTDIETIIYADEQARTNNCSAMECRHHSVATSTLMGVGLWESAYACIKEHYPDAVDC